MREEKKDFVAALRWSFLNRFYDLAVRWGLPEKKFRGKLLEELNPQPEEKILEFGAGTAQNLIWGKKKSPQTHFVGIDIDPAMKKIAEEKFQKEKLSIPYILYEGGKLPFPKEEFDKVFSSLVFHHLEREEKKEALGEIYRILKPGGMLLILDWGRAENPLMRFLFYGVQIFDGFSRTKDNIAGLLPRYMEEAGFQKVEEKYPISTIVGTLWYYRGFKL